MYGLRAANLGRVGAYKVHTFVLPERYAWDYLANSVRPVYEKHFAPVCLQNTQDNKTEMDHNARVEVGEDDQDKCIFPSCRGHKSLRMSILYCTFDTLFSLHGLCDPSPILY